MANLQHKGMPDVFDEAAAHTEDHIRDSHIRLCTATASNIEQICEVSSSATKKFGTIPGLSDLANDREEPQQVQEWLDRGRIYLAVSGDDLVGFIAAYPVDNAIYIAEVSVIESFQGKGVGGKLLDAVTQWARERCSHDGLKSARASLTTYADVPWNGQWYTKQGFKEIDPNAVGPKHVEMVADDKIKLERPGYRRCCLLWEQDAPQATS